MPSELIEDLKNMENPLQHHETPQGRNEENLVADLVTYLWMSVAYGLLLLLDLELQLSTLLDSLSSRHMWEK